MSANPYVHRWPCGIQAEMKGRGNPQVLNRLIDEALAGAGR